jgi:hypothetical protein
MKDGSCEMIRESSRCYCMVVCLFGVCRAGDDLSQRAQDGDVSSAVLFGGRSRCTRVCSDESICRREYEHHSPPNMSLRRRERDDHLNTNRALATSGGVVAAAT